jgi:PAS domain S-box-containing protein
MSGDGDESTNTGAPPAAGATPPALASALLDALFTQSPLSVAVYDAAGRVALGNAAYERLFGIRVADVPRDFSLFTDPQLEAAGLLPLIRRAYAGEHVLLPPVRYDAALAVPGAGRGAVWTQGHCYPVRDASGAVTHVAVVHADVSAHVATEQALQALNAELEERNAQLQDQTVELELQTETLQSTTEALRERSEELARTRDAVEAERARLERVITQLPAAIAVMEGPELRFRALSTAYRQIIGGRDVIGRPIREALPELSGGEGGSDFFALLERVYATGQPVVGANEVARWDDNGDGVAEEHLVDLVYAPLLGADRDDGAPPPVEGVTAFVLDVTRRARSEAAQRESEARFRTMADAAPVMLWVTDENGVCTFLNRAWYEFTGQTPAEALGLGWLDAVHPEDRPAAERAFLEANAHRREYHVDYRLRRHDGAYRWSLDTAAPRLRDDGTFLGYIGSVLDIEERTRLLEAERTARAEAEAANAAKSQFLGALHHEYRTPLNAISGYVDLLEMGLRGPVTDAQRQDLARIKRASQVLLSLVNDVLNFARVEAGALELREEDVRVDTVLRELDDLVRPQLDGRQLAFRHVGCAPTTVVRADGERVRIVLQNLLTNAIKFTGPGGRLTLRCEDDPRAGVVRLHVDDTGRGIPADKLQSIFDPFVQVDRHLTPGSQQGVGLGLAISRDLARRMGGDLTARSVLDAGSTFTLTLPRGRTAEYPAS